MAIPTSIVSSTSSTTPIKPHGHRPPREHHRPRRLTLPTQPRQNVTILQHSAQPDIVISHYTDELISHLHAIDNDSFPYTPQSSTFNCPFVLDGGMLVFSGPPEGCHNNCHNNCQDYEPSLPSSALCSSFAVFPDDPPRPLRKNTAILRRMSIWKSRNNTPAHIYTQTANQHPMPDTISIARLDPSLMHYGPVYTAMSQLQCQITHVDIPLAPAAGEQILSNNSTITISSSCAKPVRLLTSVYSRGTLLSSYEAQMERQDHTHSDATFSAPLPQELIDEVCKELHHGYEKTTTRDDTVPGEFLNSVIMMQFVQGTADKEETVLVVAGEFRTVNGSSPAQIKISSLSLDDDYSQELLIPRTFLPTPPPSHERLTSDTVSPKFPRLSKPRPVRRTIPKLSVSIPPPHMHGLRGIQLCTDSPGLTPDSRASARNTPRTGVPGDAFPETPFEQLMYTPHSPPAMSRTRARYAPTPTESAYPFTLSSTTPGPAPSPAFGVLDSAGFGSGSAPASFARNMTLFTPSLFMQHPHSASAANAMNTLAQCALDDDDDCSSSPPSACEYRISPFGSSLASPFPIETASPFPVVSRADPEYSDESYSRTGTGFPKC